MYLYGRYIPKKIVVGLREDGIGFPTMKYPSGKWANLRAFEKLIGFKPYKQRDPVAEVHKAVSCKVIEVDNAPIDGFRIIELDKDAYFPETSLFGRQQTAIIEDPRGWKVTVKKSKLLDFIAKNGFCLDNGIIKGVKLAYAWSSSEDEPYQIVAENEDTAKLIEATEKFFKDTEDGFFTPKQLEVGTVYESEVSKAKGMHLMYLGKHKVIDPGYQRIRLGSISQRYWKDNSEAKIQAKTPLPSYERYVFYNMYAYPIEAADNCMPSRHSPYFIISDVSKLVEKKVDPIEVAKCKMHNNHNLAATLENIKADMAHNAMFNEINFSTKEKCYLTVDDLVDFEWNYRERDDKTAKLDAKTWPYVNHYESPTMCSDATFNGKPLKICDLRLMCTSNVIEAHSRTYGEGLANEMTWKHNGARSRRKIFQEIVDKLKPFIWRYRFENGNLVPKHQMISLSAIAFRFW